MCFQVYLLDARRVSTSCSYHGTLLPSCADPCCVLCAAYPLCQLPASSHLGFPHTDGLADLMASSPPVQRISASGGRPQVQGSFFFLCVTVFHNYAYMYLLISAMVTFKTGITWNLLPVTIAETNFGESDKEQMCFPVKEVILHCIGCCMIRIIQLYKLFYYNLIIHIFI